MYSSVTFYFFWCVGARDGAMFRSLTYHSAAWESSAVLREKLAYKKGFIYLNFLCYQPPHVPTALIILNFNFHFPSPMDLSKVLSLYVLLVPGIPCSLLLGKWFEGQSSRESWILLNVFSFSLSWAIKCWLPSLYVIHSYTFLYFIQLL